MKILSIGNSFSQDAHRWLQKLAKQNGISFETANLYIGGCSLETHWNNALYDNADYDLEINGNWAERKISINQALKMETWDVITVQQVSQLAGMPSSYEPYISNLVAVIRTICPDAKLYFHQTWAYETDSDHGGFANYDNDQEKMYSSIINTTESVAKSINADIIPVGRVIQTLRETVTEFDYKGNGISLCRDGFHLTLDYGRYAAAATWIKTLAGKRLKPQEFEDFDIKLLEKILNVVNRI